MTNREITDKNNEQLAFYSKDKLIRGLLTALTMGGVLGYLAPFGTDQLSLVPSIGYWVVICITGYFIYAPCISLGDYWLVNKIKQQYWRVACSSLIASLLLSTVVPFISWLFFDSPIDLASQFIQVLPSTIIIGGLITLISVMQVLIAQQKQQLIQSENIIKQQPNQQSSVNNEQIDAFMALLPLEKRGELICLEMSDHYLKVYTDKGHEMLLMRFKDALAQLDQYPGLQTHRSWWVAKSAIESLSKDGRKSTLNLTNQLQVPVSKTYAEQVKELGIG